MPAAVWPCEEPPPLIPSAGSTAQRVAPTDSGEQRDGELDALGSSREVGSTTAPAGGCGSSRSAKAVGSSRTAASNFKGQASEGFCTASTAPSGAGFGKSEARLPWKSGSWVINPEESPGLRRWDLVCAYCLMFVCFVSPYEVAFMEIKITFSFMFVVNRIIDLVFVIDLILQFFVAYPRKGRYAETYITHHRRVVMHYLKGWFIIDFISVLPYDMMGAVMGSYEVSSLKALRTIRLFKLLKLVRLFRGMRIIKRWQMECGFSYRKMMLWQLMLTVVVFSHWTGCLLGLLNILQGGACVGTEKDGPPGCSVTWTSQALARTGTEYNEDGELPDAQAYFLALHTALTIIVHPHTEAPTGIEENIVFSCLLLAGGFVWTRVISRSTAIATSLDRHNIFHQQTMDDLNGISQSMGLTQPLRRRLRAFFINNREESQRKTFIELTQRMSPRLQTDVAHELNRTWVMKVRYLTTCSRPMLTDISQSLSSRFYCQMEPFGTVFALHILTRGLVSRRVTGCNVRVLTPGAVWGDDHLILCNYKLLEDVSAIAVTFCEVLILLRTRFEEILQEYPENSKKLRGEYVRLAFINGVRYLMRLAKEQKHGGESFSEALPNRVSDSSGCSGRVHFTEDEERQAAYRKRLRMQIDRECSALYAKKSGNVSVIEYNDLEVDDLIVPPAKTEITTQDGCEISMKRMSAYLSARKSLGAVAVDAQRDSVRQSILADEAVRSRATKHSVRQTSYFRHSSMPDCVSGLGRLPMEGRDELKLKLDELELQSNSLNAEFREFSESAMKTTTKLETRQRDLCQQVNSLSEEMQAMRDTLEAQLAVIINRLPRATEQGGDSSNNQEGDILDAEPPGHDAEGQGNLIS